MWYNGEKNLNGCRLVIYLNVLATFVQNFSKIRGVLYFLRDLMTKQTDPISFLLLEIRDSKNKNYCENRTVIAYLDKL